MDVHYNVHYNLLNVITAVIGVGGKSQKIFGFPDLNRNRTETENIGSVIGLTEPIDILSSQ